MNFPDSRNSLNSSPLYVRTSNFSAVTSSRSISNSDLFHISKRPHDPFSPMRHSLPSSSPSSSSPSNSPSHRTLSDRLSVLPPTLLLALRASLILPYYLVCFPLSLFKHPFFTKLSVLLLRPITELYSSVSIALAASALRHPAFIPPSVASYPTTTPFSRPTTPSQPSVPPTTTPSTTSTSSTSQQPPIVNPFRSPIDLNHKTPTSPSSPSTAKQPHFINHISLASVKALSRSQTPDYHHSFLVLDKSNPPITKPKSPSTSPSTPSSPNRPSLFTDLPTSVSLFREINHLPPSPHQDHPSESFSPDLPPPPLSPCTP